MGAVAKDTDLKSVLFIGGPWPKFGSIGIRCLDVARALGCAFQVGIRSFSDIADLDRYRIVVCVRTKLGEDDLRLLEERVTVVWDVIDSAPPDRYVNRYLASTKVVQAMYQNLGQFSVIPHHHCNFDGVLNKDNLRRPGWIGNGHWHPMIRGLDYDMYDVKSLSRDQIAALYKRVGIGLNLRAQRDGADFHAKINSGIKLINWMGFGVPSISEPEPPYLELGENCTLFGSIEECPKLVNLLLEDRELYCSMRDACLKNAEKFQIGAIAAKYRNMFAELLARS